MADFNEKRKNPRANVAFRINYKELNGKSYIAKGALAQNLSVGGVKFVSEDFVSPGRHLFLEMRLPLLAEPVSMLSRVAWIRKSSVREGYEAGNQFLAMMNQDSKFLSEFINKILTTGKLI